MACAYRDAYHEMVRVPASDKFQFRWLENNVIHIEKLTAIFVMFNHLD